jgi:rod shape determining protein RodA
MPHLAPGTSRRNLLQRLDWPLVVAALLLSGLGLVTMNSFVGQSVFFERQLVWIAAGVLVMVGVAQLDTRVLYRTSVIVALYVVILASLVLVLMFGTMVLGAQNRFDFGFFAVLPSDPAQLVLILVLAKYFARRHMDIAHIRHIWFQAHTCSSFRLLFLGLTLGRR